MTDAIAAGSILFEGGIHLPGSLMLRSESYSHGWAEARDGRPEFEKGLQAAGWTLFFMAGEIRATVFGFDAHKTMQAAVAQLIKKVKSHACNSVEITHVVSKSFLRVPYVSVFAHARHLQKGLTFSGQQ